nr:hypothetical protein B0A51_02501 [Rachicladosporium sp. CCFEE 5018]
MAATLYSGRKPRQSHTAIRRTDMGVWPAERHPSRWDVEEANQVPSSDLTERFRSALLYGEDDDLVATALTFDLEDYALQDLPISQTGYTYPMILLSSLPKLPSDYDLSTISHSYAQIFEEHAFVKELGVGTLPVSARPPHLQLAIACVAAAISDPSVDGTEGSVAGDLFHAGLKLWIVILEVDNCEARNAKAILAALLLSTYGTLSPDLLIRMKTSALICNIVTMCRRLRLTDPALSAYTTLNITERDLAGKSSLLCYMLLVDTMHALQTNDIPKYSVDELAFTMPQSGHSFRTTYISILHGCDLPDDLSATEDALLLLTALLAHSLYLQKSFEAPFAVQTPRHCSPYRPLCLETEFTDRQATINAALNVWEARFIKTMSQDVLALYHFTRLQLLVPQISDLSSFAEQQLAGEIAPTFHDIPPEAVKLAWSVLANVEDSPTIHGKKLAIWLPVVLYLSALVVWRADSGDGKNEAPGGSFSEVPDEHKSPHSAWETPDPGFWTRNGYAIVRADEIGLGQSPGVLDTMSRDTSLAFAGVIEWAADQPWSSGKVGLLGISYYAGSQWRVAARRPRGLCAIVPWEGMSDYYRDRCRHGGILSNTFIDFWWNRQVLKNQYGRPGRAAKGWCPDTIEGSLDDDTLNKNCHDQTVENAQSRFLDDDYYATRDYNMADIEVPLLSVGNWGGILLHLRGNVEGFVNAGSTVKYLRFITGRHDLPFYTPECVELQKSFLDAFLKGDDPKGWSRNEQPLIEYRVRVGDVGFNDAAAEAVYPTRTAPDWPLPKTQYTKYYLTSSHKLTTSHDDAITSQGTASFEALGDLKHPQLLSFTSKPFDSEVEFTGHVVAHLNASVTAHEGAVGTPSDIDLFVTLRHLDSSGMEIHYTGTVGDPVPVTKGWLRCSLRAVDTSHPRHKPWLPYRTYRSSDQLPVKPGEVYGVDVELWPTNVVVLPGEKLVFEVSSGDTQGAGLFEHNHPVDRSTEKYAGVNHVHFGNGRENWVMMPVIPTSGK